MTDTEDEGSLRKVLAIRLRKDERALVEQKAAEAGLPPATYIREAALHATVASMKSEIPEVNREAWAALARACANLNQYQAAINAGQATGYPPQFLEQLRDQVQIMRRALIGTREGDTGQ
ncbi:plasmid mobilization protein [Cupriavidus alkaliphilus]|uniref:plasmid mobilization protein n=1 Tax=Cupriavidus alkaliphilus TaxID=942866 RepID=UPI00339D5099